MKRLLLVGLVVLAGCQTKTVEEMNYTERKALALEIQKRCYAQGVKAGSKEYETCSRVEVQREVASRRRQAAVEDAWRATPNGPTFCQHSGSQTVCY